MDWVLLTIGAIFLISIIVGIYRGALKITVSLVTTILTLLIVFFATPYVVKIIEDKTPLDNIIQEYAAADITKAVENITGAMAEEAVANGELTEEEVEAALAEAEVAEEVENAEIPRDMQIKAIEMAELPDLFKDLLTENNNTVIYEELGVETFAQYAASYLAKLVVNILAFLGVFIFATILIRAIVFALNIVSELPVVGFVNRLAGGALGAVGALIIVWVLFVILTLLYTTSIGKEIYEVIQGNEITRLIYEYNPIMILATKMK